MPDGPEEELLRARGCMLRNNAPYYLR